MGQSDVWRALPARLAHSSFPKHRTRNPSTPSHQSHPSQTNPCIVPPSPPAPRPCACSHRVVRGVDREQGAAVFLPAADHRAWREPGQPGGVCAHPVSLIKTLQGRARWLMALYWCSCRCKACSALPPRLCLCNPTRHALATLKLLRSSCHAGRTHAHTHTHTYTHTHARAQPAACSYNCCARRALALRQVQWSDLAKVVAREGAAGGLVGGWLVLMHSHGQLRVAAPAWTACKRPGSALVALCTSVRGPPFNSFHHA